MQGRHQRCSIERGCLVVRFLMLVRLMTATVIAVSLHTVMPVRVVIVISWLCVARHGDSR